VADQDLAMQRVIEPLNELDNRRFATPRSTDQSDVRARFNGQVEVAKDANGRTSWVPEVNILELDRAFDLFERRAL
jgi:hypothetical protein